MPELRADRLSFIEALGQSIANVSPTLTPAIAVAVVVATAGTASWLVYVLATLALVVVGYNVGKLAGKISAAGSFFIYIFPRPQPGGRHAGRLGDARRLCLHRHGADRGHRPLRAVADHRGGHNHPGADLDFVSGHLGAGLSLRGSRHPLFVAPGPCA